MESLRGGLLAFWHCVNPSMASGVGLGWVGLAGQQSEGTDLSWNCYLAGSISRWEQQ